MRKSEVVLSHDLAQSRFTGHQSPCSSFSAASTLLIPRVSAERLIIVTADTTSSLEGMALMLVGGNGSKSKELNGHPSDWAARKEPRHFQLTFMTITISEFMRVI